MSRKEALTHAFDDLKHAYGLNWTRERMRHLVEVLDDYGADADHIEAAVRAHVQNTDEHNGTRIGARPPTPSDILGHIQDIEAREDRQAKLDEEETRRQQVREWEEQEASDQFKAIPLGSMPEAAQHFWQRHAARNQANAKRQGLAIHIAGDNLMIPSKKGFDYRCGECGDSGFARFWYDPKERRRVWVSDEYKRLDEAMQLTLKDFPAVCDRCLPGHEAKIRFKAAILGNGDYGQCMTTMKKIRKLAGERRLREAAQVGAVEEMAA